jgi:hypothetical protein
MAGRGGTGIAGLQGAKAARIEGRRFPMVRVLVLGACVLGCVAAIAAGADPWADAVVRYDSGGLSAGDYDNPAATLGEPSRTTAAWPSGLESVRMTVSPWQTSEVTKIGPTGELVVRFDEPVADDPGNPFGVDLLVFGNIAFASSDWPANQTIGSPLFTFGGLLGRVFVSQDDVTYYEVTRMGPMFPTHAYLSDQADAYATGATLTDFTRPVDPGLALDDFAGLTLSQALGLYAGSGGGLGIDLADLGGGAPALAWIRYVRITGETNAIDGFADVSAAPEPTTVVLLGAGLAAVLRRRRDQCRA